jgi:Cu-processing system permease protein
MMMTGGIPLFIYLRSDYLARNPIQAISMIWLNALLMLSITIFGGMFLSTLANGVLVFGLFGVAFIGGWIEQIGGFFPEFNARVSATNIGILTSMLMPSEALWKRAAHDVQSPISGALGISPFISNSIPSPLLIAYATFYLFVILFFSVYLFRRRDL